MGLNGLLVGQVTTTEKLFVPSNRWAFVVGVSNYPDTFGRLKYTSKEAREFAAELKDKLSFPADRTTLLADGGTPEESPTSEHILSSLDAILSDKRLDKANLFVFYFSGHGVGTPRGDFLLPSDVSKDRFEIDGVPVQKVISRIVGAGLKNVLFIADACRSGTENNFGRQLIELCRQANIAVILGCAPGKRSYEYPELKQGAFTHFLIEGLNDAGLRDESGSLWASKVGQQVQKKVHDYTEPDHGKFAQVPAVWAEQTTLDVLLGTYPQPPISDRAIDSFQTNAGKLNRQEFAAAMTAYAAELSANDRYDKCIDLLKAVDQLGELTPNGRYLLATSLSFLGRVGEAERTFVTFKSMPEGYYRDLAFATCSSKAIDPKLRIRAAMKLFETDPSWVVKMLAYASVNLAGTYEQRVHMARLFAKTKQANARQRLYAEGCLAVQEGRWQAAVNDFRNAASQPGQYPGNHVLFISQLAPTLGLADAKALDVWIEQGLQNKDTAVIAYLEKAWVAKGRGDDKGRVAALRAALNAGPDEDQLWLAVKTAGPLIGQLQPEIKAASDKSPYSWQARLIRSFINLLKGDTKAAQEDAAAEALYREDPLTYNSKIFELMESMLSEASMMGRIPELTYRQQVDYFFVNMLGYAPRLGYDADLWMQLTKFGMLNERNMQVEAVIRKFLPFTPESMPKSLRPMVMFLALNTGQTETLRRLFAASFEPTEGDDTTWLYASYLATRGREAEAAKMISKLKPASDNLMPRMEAMKTYLLVKTGHEKQARARLKTAIDDLVVRAFNGLAWASMGDWKKAEPLLAEQAKSRNWAFLYVSEYAMQVYDAHLRKLGQMEKVRGLALSAAASQPGNPIFKKYSYAAKPGVAQFAGTVTMKCVAIDDRRSYQSMEVDGKKTYFFGKLSFTVAKDGSLSGLFIEENGDKHPFKGRVDALGNVEGSCVWVGHACTVQGKIAPASVYKTYKGFDGAGQIFHVMDSDGYRVALVGQP